MVLLFLLLILFGFVFPIVITLYHIFCLVSEFKGAPYVPTSGKIVKEILNKANLKKGQNFIELGSGDGRVVRAAVKNFKVKGLGVDIHVPLIWYSKIISRLQKVPNIEFRIQDFFKTDLSKVDVLFLFLLPNTLKKLREKILKECPKNTLIISHGFQIEGMEKYLESKIHRTLFPTYFYRI
ncbi:MAG: Methyltransferase type 11 [Candidatus Daviesbacteria bacterium GW2011_GWA2_38_24]|uniref:Methyltransferase type 11 n=1 Tax=Candidatus Daviesbacteria bacterium GW2011_GWA2_38_24 TaxID=1618422 RepID=A0A0G0M0Z3_9BACT|nr:MAG: Methyltransferase type 11 [Candidatus Daviesbacteria bacterium GW2011_GWA2_38_24]KKQ79678.1 MAG: Methyltransferase type 11 [Candidatus Daviesbacteria bacterium GW2011_GWA1_38_7]OGE24709.1 MAG: hypothetical protein A2688_01720 [Candidatus Daviesbacteria bacterium RIFCSPHIGHO2_01_FULL_38_8]